PWTSRGTLRRGLRFLGDVAGPPRFAVEAEASAERSAGCPWLDVALQVRVPLPGKRRRRVRSLQRLGEPQDADPVDRRVLVRQWRPGGLVARRTPVGAGVGEHARPPGDRDDALTARGQLDR